MRESMLPAGPLPRGGPAGAGWAWSDLIDDSWQDLLGRLEAAVDEIEEIGLPVERHPTPCGHVLDHAAEGAPFVVLLAGCRCPDAHQEGLHARMLRRGP
jgi:hypothetical protein